MTGHEFRAREAMARAGADLSINLAREAVAAYDGRQMTIGETLILLATAGREGERVVIAAWFDFLNEKVGS